MSKTAKEIKFTVMVDKKFKKIHILFNNRKIHSIKIPNPKVVGDDYWNAFKFKNLTWDINVYFPYVNNNKDVSVQAYPVNKFSAIYSDQRVSYQQEL